MSIVYQTKEGGTTEIFKGCVLETRERNFYDDSDFYAVVWDDEKKALSTPEYATTRYGGGGTAFADATPEVRAAADAWAYKTLKKGYFQRYVKELADPEKGDMVTIVRGKSGKGSTGKLFWIGEKKTYGGYSRWSQNTVQKVGVALDDEKNEKGQYKNVVWTYLGNVEAVVSSKYKISEAKRLMKGLKRSGYGAWLAYQAAPLAFVP